ncbi:MAG: hypothetical protein ACYC8T_01645 [Myxococcaceae bacterium]
MTRSIPLWGLALLLCAGCVGHDRLARVQLLSDDEKELYGKYKQFMTEGQQEEFLAAPTPTEREEYIRALRVEERLAHYPAYVQDAIWKQDIVPGMDAAAVLLTWSVPVLREWDETERAKGNDIERWSYRRDGKFKQVVLTNGVVTRVVEAEGEH